MAITDKILLNTDVLLHAADSTSRLHQQAYAVREMDVRGDIKACVSYDVLCELLLAFTSNFHVQNPLGITDAIGEYEKYVNLKSITKIMQLPETFKTLNLIIKEYGLTGSDVKLAEHIATMIDNRVHIICTFRQEEYEKFKEINVLNPFEFDNRQTRIQFGE